MARKQTQGIEQVNIQGAANRIDTFVYGARAEKSNSALSLAAALKGTAEAIDQYQEVEHKLDVAAATEQKLYGGTLFSTIEAEGIADYDTLKESLGSMEAAEEYYLSRTAPSEDVTDPHVLSGYAENQVKGLGAFRGKHAKYLAELKQETRGRDVFNDFYNNVGFAFSDNNLPPSPKVAFDRLSQIADNFGIPKKDMNTIPLGVAEVLISQGKFDQAESILLHSRGPAGSLLDNPETNLQAQKLMNNINTENKVILADTLKGLEDKTLAGIPFNDTDKAVMNKYLEDKNLTVDQRNKLLTANDEAVKVSGFATALQTNLTSKGKSFFDPIPGATIEQTEKARKKYTEDFYNDIEKRRAEGRIDPASYATRTVMFAEQTNSVNPEMQRRFGAGMSTFNPNEVIANGTADGQTIAAVAEYIMMHDKNPNVAAAHLQNEKAVKFYDDLAMDLKFGGNVEEPVQTRIERALLNYAKDAVNPLRATSDIRIAEEDILSTFRTVTKEAADRGIFDWGPNQGPASNSLQWMPYIKKRVQEAAGRNGAANKNELLKHVVKDIVSRSVRIGDYLVPRGTNTVMTSEQDLNELNDKVIGNWIATNSDTGYTAEELVIAPIIGQENMWGVTVKGSNAILEVIPQDKLPVKGAVGGSSAIERELPQLKQDEGTRTNSKGEHISYKDSLGYLTGGHGHLMTEEEKKMYPEGTPIPQDVIDKWFEQDKKAALEDVKAVFGSVENPEAEQILTNMAFNLGRSNLNEFKRLKKAIKDKDYKLAAQSMRESLWAKQVGSRADRLIARMESLA